MMICKDSSRQFFRTTFNTISGLSDGSEFVYSINLINQFCDCYCCRHCLSPIFNLVFFSAALSSSLLLSLPSDGRTSRRLVRVLLLFLDLAEFYADLGRL